MTVADLLIDRRGRLRSGWRLLVFGLCFFVTIFALWLLYAVAAQLIFKVSQEWLAAFFQSRRGLLFISLISLAAAIFAGWLCGRWLEDLPARALGWGRHEGWLRDLLIGSLYGGLSLGLAVLIGWAGGGYGVGARAAGASAVAANLLGSLLILLVAAAFEEALFRGYPLQTMLRSNPVWVASIPSFVLFGVVHLRNPNVVPGFTFVNTALAGIWLAVGYLRTRSLWFPLGLHWAWNWMMGPVLGLPVSGIMQMSGGPLVPLVSVQSDWLTGGAYGPEGGLNSTVSLIASIIFLWRTKTLRAREEMKKLTSREDE
ncbi:MAG TPA: type II CAAX endopeptidase family protein, partial [Pyrinomonadaceae bacterium]|nr:type II CAAX endopeptidase family protein [Pyrinomonadaceae bacterium]